MPLCLWSYRRREGNELPTGCFIHVTVDRHHAYVMSSSKTLLMIILSLQRETLSTACALSVSPLAHNERWEHWERVLFFIRNWTVDSSRCSSSSPRRAFWIFKNYSEYHKESALQTLKFYIYLATCKRNTLRAESKINRLYAIKKVTADKLKESSGVLSVSYLCCIE